MRLTIVDQISGSIVGHAHKLIIVADALGQCGGAALRSSDFVEVAPGIADYYPFGGESVVSGSDINNYKFTGKERDSESNLDSFGARHYAGAFGRFMQSDPSGLSIDKLNPQR